MTMGISLLTVLGLLSPSLTSSFVPSHIGYSITSNHRSPLSCEATTEDASQLSTNVKELKKVLAREYTTFFNPMFTEYYASDVTFDDPMTSFSGVGAYQNNVDMLASRTLMGKFLFEDAGIVLHSVKGGAVNYSTGEIDEIVTRWTLRLTAKVLPWKPTARFSGVSVYKVKQNSSSEVGVSIVGQMDYWDSINIIPGSDHIELQDQYRAVEKSKGISDFLNQLSPGGFQAQAAAPELPYQLLRRGNGYEVRRYPAYSGAKLPYRRRDEGFGSLGAFTKGMSPLSPAIMEVKTDDVSDKFMLWPLGFQQPGELSTPVPMEASEKAGQGQWRTMRVEITPSKVVAVKEFSDASMEPVVRKADRELRADLKRDGLVPNQNSEELIRFAQYDAVFSMGKRRGEVWVDLVEGGHPW